MAAHGETLFRGPTIPFDPELAEALDGDMLGALTLQQVRYLGASTPERWYALPGRLLARMLACDKEVARDALGRLVDRGLLEVVPGSGSQADQYRVNVESLKALCPRRKLGHWADSQAQIAPETQAPLSVPERDSEEASFARARERETERKKKNENENYPRSPSAGVGEDMIKEEEEELNQRGDEVEIGETVADLAAGMRFA